MKGCHRRKRPKCTSSQTRWNSLPGAEMSATCSASSIASTTQRRWVATRAARRCAVEPGKKAIESSVGKPTRGVGTADRLAVPAPRGKSSESRIILRNNILLPVARRLHYPRHRTRDNQEKQMKSQQSGFTLVEIAIVLVIIGLLLGGILKGQELINSAKVKNLANDFRVIPTYIYAFQDKFKALPGYDSSATTHLTGSTAATTPAANQDNGVINCN